MKNKTLNTGKARRFLYTLLVICIFCGSVRGQNNKHEIEYLEYCKADSNAILVGFRYVTSEDSLEGWKKYCEIYNPKYHLQLEYDEHRYYCPSYYYFEEDSVWAWRLTDLKDGYDYKLSNEYRDYIDNYKYIRCEKITIPITPTFEGYVRWRSKKYCL